MRKSLRSLACGAIVLATVPFGGCQLASFTISIPDFMTKQVSGVWLWRQSPTTGVFERDGQLVFGATGSTTAGETIDYTATPSGGAAGQPCTAQVVRDATNPDHVTLQLIFTRSQDAGYYRASTFNTTGDSPLSVEILPL
jgi:hypothetical protein